ncbi:MAG: 6,7-dimethyl-8-ribityllumazine synthase [Sphingobacteriales bacterium]|nr:MAG: 6,7-dimethyl-8-ribityllumazine synthase [Sphingobacteriales bacterium]
MSKISNEQFNTAGIRVKPGACVVIVRTDWNAHVIDKLEEGCLRVLKEKNAAIKVLNVPGAFEIPFAIKSYWENTKYKDCKPDAFIALGCVIKGDTPHFDYVCKAVTDGVVQLNLELPIPTIFGVITVNTQAQADERTGGIHGHKGEEAAATALKMIALLQSYPKT